MTPTSRRSALAGPGPTSPPPPEGSFGTKTVNGNTGSSKKYPHLRRVFPFCVALTIIYMYRLWSFSSTYSQDSGDMYGCESEKNAHHISNTPGSPEVIDSMVLMDSLASDKLRTIGGTGHWFHLLERLIPALPAAAQHVWSPAYKSSRSGSKAHPAAMQHLYIVFREAIGPEGLDSFGRLVLASVLSGGYFDKVMIGHSADIATSEEKSPVEDGSKRYGRAVARNFVLSASLLFHPGEPVPYSEALMGQLADHHSDEHNTHHASSFRHANANVNGEDFTVCAKYLMQFSWNLAPNKRYDLVGKDRTRYDLLHSAVDRACGWEELVGTGEFGTYGRKKDLYAEFMKTVDPSFQEIVVTSKLADALGTIGTSVQDEGVLQRQPDAEMPVLADDYLVMKDQYGIPLEPSQIQSQLLQAALGSSQDDLAFPSGARMSRKLKKFRNLHCTSGCNGTNVIMTATNAAGINVLGWNNYALYHVAQMKKLYVSDIEHDNAATTASVVKQLQSRSSPAYLNVSIVQEREFILPPAPIATDVPLTVLVYDRDETRRLQNAGAVIAYLRKWLPLKDDHERHAYFPVYYSDENAPKRKPKLGLGTLGEVSKGKGHHSMRRKSGGQSYDKSHHMQYTHENDKENWIIDSMIHNQFNTHNEHVHVSGISGKQILPDKGQMGTKSRFRVIDRIAGNLGEEVGEEEEGEGEDEEGEGEDEDEDEKKEKEKARKGQDMNTLLEREARRLNTESYSTVTSHHPPCHLIRSVKDATVLITPHGFQSILLLFQPLKSLLIEIMPFAYNKPEIYGFIQAGIRSIPEFGEFRSYLVHESHPTTLTSKVLHWLGLTGETAEDEGRQHWFPWSQKSCTKWAFCRFLVRQQDLVVDEAFLRRATDFIRNHFISNQSIKTTKII